MNRGKFYFEKYADYVNGLKDLNTAIEIDSSIAEGFFSTRLFLFQYHKGL